MLDVRLRVFVDDNGTTCARLDARCREAEALGVGNAADGAEDLVEDAHRLVVERRGELTCLGALDLVDGCLEPKVDVGLGQVLRDRAANVFIETAEHEVASMDQGDLASESGKNVCELDADVAAADDGNSGWQLVEVEGLVGVDRVLGAWDVGHKWAAARWRLECAWPLGDGRHTRPCEDQPTRRGQ